MDIMPDWRRSLVLVAILAIGSASPTRAGQEPEASYPPDEGRQQSVLFLAVEDFTRPYVRILFESFSDRVLAAPRAPAIYFESLDATRFEQKEYLDDVRDWLSRKYDNTRIDLVMPLGEDALGFLADAHGEPWPAAQVLYLESGTPRVDTRSRLPQTGGVQLEDSFFGALEVMKAILPETKHVALLYGASAIEVTRYNGFAEKVRNAGFEPIELFAMSMEQMLAEVARLPAQTVAFILQPSVDASGHALAPRRACELIASNDRVPAFSLGAQDLGCGVVGGLMRDWTIVGRLMGEEALARLSEPSTEIVTVPIAKYATLAFDDRQLARWGIPERRLPAGAVVRFREPNLWRDRRGLVMATIGVTVFQSLLIAGLVLERRRRRRAEVDSRRNLSALAHLDRRAAMGELATSLAHELNQPLNAILQNAGVAQMMLASAAVPPALAEIPDIISDIRKDDVRASEMIRRMRGLLQKHELDARPVDLNEVAEETLAIVRPDARAREVELEMNLADPLAPVLGDRVHLQQVLLNLLMNALAAVSTTPRERRRVRVSTSQFNGDVRLAVSDTGTGIPLDRLRQIFEPFYTTKSEGGMGMGLAIARGIVEAHGGRIEAENNAGGGATVWFSVPKGPAR
jgi:signal transduction histidine kinase